MAKANNRNSNRELNKWVSYLDMPLQGVDISQLKDLYAQFILGGKSDLLNYLGKEALHPTWVSGDSQEESVAMSVCNRNMDRSKLFEALNEFGHEYYNEVYVAGILTFWVGSPITIDGYLSDVGRFMCLGALGTPLIDTWDDRYLYI